MRVHGITLSNFRNYTNLELEFSKNINIFIGANAQGKTNLLEALYLSAMGKSHRSAMEKEMIMWDKGYSIVDTLFSRQEIENSLKIELFNNQRKKIILNSHPLNPKELIGSLTAVLFSPEDLLMIKGAPALRRHFLDNEISQASKPYYHQMLNYNRIISQRNNLLKKIREKKSLNKDIKELLAMLDMWNAQMVKSASYITLKRLDVVKKLTMMANLCHRRITSSKENLSIVYSIHNLEDKEIDNFDFQNWYYKKLKENEAQDIYRGSTNIGPHLDDLVMLVNGKNLKNFGSQGQQRTGVLALKLAELEFIKSETGEYPILLLDDVMSELDEGRRKELLLFIKERIQTFITTTEEKYFPARKIGRFYKIDNAKVI